jgi:hypothetical protein
MFFNPSFLLEIEMTEKATRSMALRAEDPAQAGEFDYGREAELFGTRPRKNWGRGMAYRRFSCAADAIQFAVEQLPSNMLPGVCLQVDDERVGGADIRRLYDSTDYPLARPSPAP